MKKSLSAIFTIFFWIIFISCANDDSNNTISQNIETTLTITDDEGNESSVFDQGEYIKLIIKMGNLTNETQTVKFSVATLRYRNL